MAREDGYVRLACDRAEAVHPGGAMPVEYMRPEDKRYAEWNGVGMRMTLCPDCAAKLRSIMETHDRDMTDFANEGRR